MTSALLQVPSALTVAGSDSGGGAGIQADLKTFQARGVFGAAAITALTAQNTRGVQGVHVPPAGFLTDQLNAVLGDLEVHAVKTGMLPDSKVSGGGLVPHDIARPFKFAPRAGDCTERRCCAFALPIR